MGSYVDLLRACKECNPKKIKKFLGSFKNIADICDSNDRTLLHYCFHSEVCADLILEVAPELLNVPDKCGFTVLHFAAMMKSVRPVRYILSKNPDINKLTNELRTPLLLSVIYERYDAVEILCGAGANVMIPDNVGASPLHYVSKAKSDNGTELELRIIDFLLQKNVNIDCQDFFKRTPLIYTVTSNNPEKMRHLLLRGADIDCRDNDGLSLLHYAAYGDNLDILVSLLSEYNFDIDVVDDNGCTSLMYACNTGHTGMVRALIDRGANLNAIDEKRRSVVHYACRKGDKYTMVILAECNANLWLSDIDENMPLHEAAHKGHDEVVKIFMERPSPGNRILDLVNKRNIHGQTPFHLAVYKDHVTTCRILLENGADPNMSLRASCGRLVTAFDLTNFSATQELLVTYDGRKAEELSVLDSMVDGGHLSSSGCSVNDIESLVHSNCFPNHGNDINGKNDYFDLGAKHDDNNVEVTKELREKLLECSASGQIEVIRSFAEKGVPLCYIVDETGKHLLHYSIRSKEAFALLIDLAPDLVNRCDQCNMSVLHHMIVSGENGHLRLLLEKGADFNFPNDCGRTSLHLVVIHDNIETLNIISQSIEDIGRFVHQRDVNGKYPLHYAIDLFSCNGYNSKQFIETLLIMNGDIDCFDNDCKTPLIRAVISNNLEALSLLVDLGANTIACDNSGLCSIHYACFNGHLDTLHVLSKSITYDPNIQNQLGLPPIFYAVTCGYHKIVNDLIEQGAELNTVDHDDKNLVHLASENGATECLELILLHNIDPWHISKKGTMPLHEAVIRGYKEIVKLILGIENSHQYVNIKTSNGQTALHLASLRNDEVMCALLIDGGCNINEHYFDCSNNVDISNFNVATNKQGEDILYDINGRLPMSRQRSTGETDDLCDDYSTFESFSRMRLPKLKSPSITDINFSSCSIGSLHTSHKLHTPIKNLEQSTHKNRILYSYAKDKVTGTKERTRNIFPNE